MNLTAPTIENLDEQQKVHMVKIDQAYFDAVNYRLKTAELRKNDRDYEVGDMLILAEYERKTKRFTDRKIPFIIKHITTHKDFEGLKPGYVMLSLGTLPTVNDFK